MAAQLKGDFSQKGVKPELVNKLQVEQETVNMALFIPHEEAVITVATDKSIRVWIQRENLQFWPSVCHYMPETGVCLDYNKESGKIFVGQSSGMIQEYELSDDCNKLKLIRNYLAHKGNINAVLYSLDYTWLLSCGNDKYMQWHCTRTGKRRGGYSTRSQCNCVQFDEESCYVFVGDNAGEVHVLRLSNEGLKPITTLKGHSGSIQCVSWDTEKKWLYSGSADGSIIIWDIGGQKGSAFELHGSCDKVMGMCLTGPHKTLFSVTGGEPILAVWDLCAERLETPTWSQSNMCEKCATPFFWNFKQMWEEKAIGVRQHHCRKCGRAVCQKCSNSQSTLPRMGFEYAVRVCNDCHVTTTDQERITTTVFHKLHHTAKLVSVDLSKKRMLTCGSDSFVFIWDIRGLLT